MNRTNSLSMTAAGAVDMTIHNANLATATATAMKIGNHQAAIRASASPKKHESKPKQATAKCMLT